MRMRRKAALCLTLWAALTVGSTLVSTAAAHADEPVKAAPAEPAAIVRDSRKAEPPTRSWSWAARRSGS